MRKLILGLTILVSILMSCREDEERVIQTDLPIEASELFSITKDWNESLYFAMASWEEYQSMDTVDFPGSLDILLDETTKEVTLHFLTHKDSIKSGSLERSGKLIIRFDTTKSSTYQRWTMTYEDYFFGTNSIKGTRSFESEDSINVSEEFTNLTKKTENNLSSEFSGEFLHTRAFTSDSIPADSTATEPLKTHLVSFTSIGRIEGVDAAGRNFEISTDIPLSHSVSCYLQNEIVPNSGKESWFVSRGNNSGVTYTTTYGPLPDSCKVAANATLPDGKKLLLNPQE